MPGAEPFLETSLGGAAYVIQSISGETGGGDTEFPVEVVEVVPEKPVHRALQQAFDVVARHSTIWSMRNADALAAMPGIYAKAVNFYGKTITRDEVMREKVAFAKRWPMRRYRFQPNADESVCSSDRRCVVRGTVAWYARSDKLGKTSTGVALVDIDVARIDGRFRIVGETSEVLSRHTEVD